MSFHPRVSIHVCQSISVRPNAFFLVRPSVSTHTHACLSSSLCPSVRPHLFVDVCPSLSVSPCPSVRPSPSVYVQSVHVHPFKSAHPCTYVHPCPSVCICPFHDQFVSPFSSVCPRPFAPGRLRTSISLKPKCSIFSLLHTLRKDFSCCWVAELSSSWIRAVMGPEHAAS